MNCCKTCHEAVDLIIDYLINNANNIDYFNGVKTQIEVDDMVSAMLGAAGEVDCDHETYEDTAIRVFPFDPQLACMLYAAEKRYVELSEK